LGNSTAESGELHRLRVQQVSKFVVLELLGRGGEFSSFGALI
jgi:hypothetical protein